MSDLKFEEPLRAIANAGWGVKSDGDMEAPCGYFTVIQIPEPVGERAEMREAVFEDETQAAAFDTISAGWYFVVQDSDGLLAKLRCEDEKEAFSCYRNSEDVFQEWVGDEAPAT